MYSEQEYLELEREAEYKSEYFRGEIFAMAGAGHNHNRIVQNLSGECYIAFKGKSCHTFSNDMRLNIPENGLYTYPDVIIVCGRNEFLDEKKDTLVNPNVIIEVLSSSTSSYDRGEKFHFYRSIPSLCEYVVIDSSKIAAEVYRKDENGFWYIASEGYAIDEFIELKSVELRIALKDIYAETEDILVR
ncbi:Uma2 family endonuclease [Dyadobacter sp. CY323]|uniref:Uma2 family endonuclease n=1 Tax=Dyadobacter sp. CY323 TaxID=2907302 RepID=UPI001F41F9BD|nr:Uma2 family endonuclease [Dyadobacter sp. CY323]MCE6992742.1 Uma2 family endonuclease [Dyadobacter sp. CY323]